MWLPWGNQGNLSLHPADPPWLPPLTYEGHACQEQHNMEQLEGPHHAQAKHTLHKLEHSSPEHPASRRAPSVAKQKSL